MRLIETLTALKSLLRACVSCLTSGYSVNSWAYGKSFDLSEKVYTRRVYWHVITAMLPWEWEDEIEMYSRCKRRKRCIGTSTYWIELKCSQGGKKGVILYISFYVLKAKAEVIFSVLGEREEGFSSALHWLEDHWLPQRVWATENYLTLLLCCFKSDRFTIRVFFKKKSVNFICFCLISLHMPSAHTKSIFDFTNFFLNFCVSLNLCPSVVFLVKNNHLLEMDG